MKKRLILRKKFTLRVVLKIVRETFRGFSDNNVTQLSASLAYATLFSMIPFISFLITIGTFFKVDIANQLYSHLQPIVGMDAVRDLRDVIQNADSEDASTLATIVTVGITIFGATAIFAEIQGSLNTIWRITPVPPKSWLKYIKNRLLSFSIILVFAFILLITFAISNVISSLSGRIMANYPEIEEWAVRILGMVINLAVTTFIFILIYKILPDAKINFVESCSIKCSTKKAITCLPNDCL